MQQRADKSHAVKDDEVSLKTFLLNVRSWIKYLWKSWLLIVIFGVVGAGLGLWYAWNQKSYYIGDLTFVMEDGKSGGTIAAYAGLASQFGIDLGGGGSSGLLQGDNVMEFLKSRLIVEKALLSPETADGKTSLADLYVKANDIKKTWKNNPALMQLSFPPNQERSTFSLLQDSVLNTLQAEIVKHALFIGKVDKKLSFIYVQCKSVNETFTKLFTERLVSEAADFYVDIKTKRSQANIDKLQKLADSLELALNKKAYSTAASQDLNANPARQVASVGVEIGQRDKMITQTMYGEVFKNLELSKVTMAQETPVVQIVDRPILPLRKEKFGKVKGLILGGFCGSLIVLLYLIGKLMYRNIMENE